MANGENDLQELNVQIEYLRASENVDFMNNRHLLLTCMQGFANKCESRTRFLVPLFLRFLE